MWRSIGGKAVHNDSSEVTLPASVLFVCLGNICRSPTAEGVFCHRLQQAGFADRVRVDSAGTGAWHVGKAPDERARHAAGSRGYDLSRLRARQVRAQDFEDFDLILAMDQSNLHDLQSLCPEEYQHKIRLLLDYADGVAEREVPDPYYGDGDGFQRVLDLVENASDGLLSALRGQP